MGLKHVGANSVTSVTAYVILYSYIQVHKLVQIKSIFDAPWYIRNADLHRDLQIEMVTNEIGKFATKHEERLLHHINVEAVQLLENSELVRRLKKNF